MPLVTALTGSFPLRSKRPPRYVDAQLRQLPDELVGQVTDPLPFSY